MPYILTSQTSEYEATSQLTSPCDEARWASFLVPRTSHEASQPACIVNEASELSIALTRLESNSPRLALSCLVAISAWCPSLLTCTKMPIQIQSCCWNPRWQNLFSFQNNKQCNWSIIYANTFHYTVHCCWPRCAWYLFVDSLFTTIYDLWTVSTANPILFILYISSIRIFFSAMVFLNSLNHSSRPSFLTSITHATSIVWEDAVSNSG